MNQTLFQNMDSVTQALKELEFEGARAVHIYDPCDVQTLFGLLNTELQKDADSVDASLLVEFLIFHRAQIKPSLVGHIRKILGRIYSEMIQKNTIPGLVDVAEGSEEDPSDVFDRLMDITRKNSNNPEEEVYSEWIFMAPLRYHSDICIAIGDYYLINAGDLRKACSYYRRSLEKNPGNISASQRLLAVVEFQGAWSDAVNILDGMISTSDDDTNLRYLCKKGWILKQKCGDFQRADECFNRALDIKPECYDIFLKMNTMYNFDGIDNNFINMIERVKNRAVVNKALLSVLYRDYAEFRFQQLNDLAGAIEAFKSLSKLHEDNIHFHLLLAHLYEMNEHTRRDAIAEYRSCLALSLEYLPALSGLAACYRQLGMFDESLCTYRVINALHFNDENGDGIVKKFADMRAPEITNKISSELWTYIIPETLDRNIVKILKICSKAIGDMFANEYSTYGINERSARIDISKDTMFNNSIRNEAQALGFAEIPLLYRCERFSGVTNAFFTNRSFLIHPNCLKNRSHKELAFITAKAMMLIRPEYYLLELGLKNVELILLAIIAAISPTALNCSLDKNQVKIVTTLDRSLTLEDREDLKSLIEQVCCRKGLNVLLFMESVEDLANRVALLFCDDPTIVESLLSEESKPITSRTMHSRMKTLMRWALSEDYFTLRKKLNIALRA